MGFTATDGETEGLAWSHRGSTYPVPRLCSLPVVYPRFSTQLCLAENTLASAPLLFRGLQWSRGGERKRETSAPHSPRRLGELSCGELSPHLPRYPAPCSAPFLHPGHHLKRQRIPSAQLCLRERAGRSPPKAYRTMTCCHPCLAPSSPFFNLSAILNAAGKGPG